MAKWGEGDPRWIVEERPDATNVNNWHWTEKNATNWSKDKLKELLTGLVIETEEGIMKESDKKYKGKFDVPNLSEEHEPDEIDVNVSVDTEKGDCLKLKEIMRKTGTPLMQKQFATYIKCLKEEYSQNVILPTKNQENVKKTTEEVMNAKVEMSKMVINSTSPADNKSVGVKIDTKTVTLEEEFVCAPPQLYRVFTDKEMVQAFTGASAIYEVEKGGRISLMNGYVTGGFVELVPEEKIVMRWRLKTWPDVHFSEVTLEFKEKDGNTLLKVKQTGVPSSGMKKTIEGWKVNYWQRIKQTFGMGSHIF